MDDKQKDVPKKLHLLWFNLLVVVPFLALLVRAVLTHDFRYAFWTLMLAPVALVTIGLDAYKAIQHFRSK